MSKRNAPVAIPSSSHSYPTAKLNNAEKTIKNNCLKFVYDKETKLIFGRTPLGWLQIITYSIMYIIFLMTYTLILLYISLTVIKQNGPKGDKALLNSYSDSGIGLTVVPSVKDKMLISYQKDKSQEYQPYVDAIDSFLDVKKNRSKRETRRSELGPCGTPPYGYGEAPCIIVRINKQLGWSAKPLTPGTTAAEKTPPEVQKWLKTDKKLWLHCSGRHTWDTEHIMEMKYYPNPPGFDPSLFPMNITSNPPLVAVQFTKFTLGMSLAIDCKMFYENGTSSVTFVLYVDH